jgi:hypothetical protein
MDATNGAICHVATQAADNIFGFASQYLMHIPNTVWSPPMFSAPVTPSAYTISDDKYGIVYNPSTAYDNVYRWGHYVSVAYYQPKYASHYTLISRYGKAGYVGSFCM